MPPDTEVRPITADDAAQILGRAPSTIRCWAFRFNAHQLPIMDRKRYYDFNDLAVIEREIRHGHPVPSTPEERAAVRRRCPLVAAPLTAA